MKKMILALFILGLISSIARADEACGAKKIKVGNDQVELVKVENKPDQAADGKTINGADEVLVSGIYMFVRNAQMWNVYRCADDVKRDKAGSPVLNLDKCVLKNDFEFGNIVKRYGNSGVTVRKTDSNRLQIRLNVSGTEELDYYDVKSTSEGLEVIQSKFQKNLQKPYLSHHENISLGVCKPNHSKTNVKVNSPNSSGQSKKVKSAN